MESLAKLLKDRPKSFPGEWLSVSKIKIFKDCPAKYKYLYVDRLPRKSFDFQILGQLAHSCLEYFYSLIKDGDVRPNNKIMTDAFKLAAKIYPQADTDQKKEVWVMMNNYLNKIAKDANDNTLPRVTDIEGNFYIDIDGKVLLNGFIDRVQIDADGMLHVVDYKTTKSKSYLKDDTLQLQTYAYVKCLQFPELARIRTSYMLLKHDFESIVKEYSRKQIMKIENRFLQYAKDIKAEKLWRPSIGNLCKFCDFLEICDEGKESFYKKINVKYGESDWSKQ